MLPGIRSLLVVALGTIAACSSKSAPVGGGGTSSSLTDLMKARDLSEADVNAALKTYTPTGRMDEYLAFSSGGQSGQVIVIGLPSMRILKYIAVFTPEATASTTGPRRCSRAASGSVGS